MSSDSHVDLQLADSQGHIISGISVTRNEMNTCPCHGLYGLENVLDLECFFPKIREKKTLTHFFALNSSVITTFLRLDFYIAFPMFPNAHIYKKFP